MKDTTQVTSILGAPTGKRTTVFAVEFLAPRTMKRFHPYALPFPRKWPCGVLAHVSKGAAAGGVENPGPHSKSQ